MKCAKPISLNGCSEYCLLLWARITEFSISCTYPLKINTGRLLYTVWKCVPFNKPFIALFFFLRAASSFSLRTTKRRTSSSREQCRKKSFYSNTVKGSLIVYILQLSVRQMCLKKSKNTFREITDTRHVACIFSNEVNLNMFIFNYHYIERIPPPRPSSPIYLHQILLSHRYHSSKYAWFS